MRHHADAAQAGCDGGRLAVAERSADAQALATSASSVAACHDHGCPRLVSESWLVEIEVESALEPFLAALQDIGTLLLRRVTVFSFA